MTKSLCSKEKPLCSQPHMISSTCNNITLCEGVTDFGSDFDPRGRRRYFPLSTQLVFGGCSLSNNERAALWAADSLSGSVALLRDWELEHAMIGHKFLHVAPEGTAHSTSVKIFFYAPFFCTLCSHARGYNYAQYYARIMYASLVLRHLCTCEINRLRGNL